MSAVRGNICIPVAGIAQGLERLTVAEEAVGSRPIIRPILFITDS
jgi:hypothetical protein